MQSVACEKWFREARTGQVVVEEVFRYKMFSIGQPSLYGGEVAGRTVWRALGSLTKLESGYR